MPRVMAIWGGPLDGPRLARALSRERERGILGLTYVADTPFGVLARDVWGTMIRAEQAMLLAKAKASGERKGNSHMFSTGVVPGHDDPIHRLLQVWNPSQLLLIPGDARDDAVRAAARDAGLPVLEA